MEAGTTTDAAPALSILYNSDDIHAELFSGIRVIRKMKHPVIRNDGELIQHQSAEKYLGDFRHNYSARINRSMIPEKMGIYLIYCIPSKRGYIGKSKKMKTRLSHHEGGLRRGVHINPHLQHAFNLYTGTAFIAYPLEIVKSEGELDAREAYWATVYESFEHGYNIAPMRTDGLDAGNGEFNQGESNGGSKLSESQVIEICNHLNEGELGLTDISKKFDISPTLVMTIKDGKKWKYLTKDYLDFEAFRKKKRNIKRLTNFEIIDICMRLNRNEFIPDMAREFDITQQAIYKMRKGVRSQQLTVKYLSQRFIQTWNII